MNDLAQRLAKLSPEQRNTLLEKIRKQTKQEADQAPAVQATPERPFVKEDRNYVLRIGKVGDPDSLMLQACPRPAVRPGEVEIEVCAASLNFRDIMIALGLYPTGKDTSMGGDCAGRITAIGENVDQFRVGDEVIASTGDSFSAFTSAAASDVVPKPAHMSFVEAATIPTVFLTAYYSLHCAARLSKGERVLIHSAAGGVGLAAVQVAQWLGAEIIATVGSAEKREYLHSLGIALIANSRNADFDKEVKELTGGQGVDVVLNSLSGPAIPKGLSLLKVLGRFVELGKRDLYSDGHLNFASFRKFVTFFPVDLGPVSQHRPGLFHSMFVEIMDHFATGTFRLVPIREFSIADISEAFSYMAQSQHIGKIAIRVENEQVLITPR